MPQGTKIVHKARATHSALLILSLSLSLSLSSLLCTQSLFFHASLCYASFSLSFSLSLSFCHLLFISSGPNRCRHCLFCSQSLGHHDCLMKVVAMETTNIREHRGGYVCEDCSPVLLMEQSKEMNGEMDNMEVSMDVSSSPQIRRSVVPSDNWEVVDLTTPLSSRESCIDKTTWPSLVSHSSANASSTIRIPSNSTQLTLAPPNLQLPCSKSKSYTITLCTCDECISKSPSPTTSSSVVKGVSSRGDKDAAIVQQLLVSISTHKLASIPETKQRVRKFSSKRQRPCLS